MSAMIKKKSPKYLYIPFKCLGYVFFSNKLILLLSKDALIRLKVTVRLCHIVTKEILYKKMLSFCEGSCDTEDWSNGCNYISQYYCFTEFFYQINSLGKYKRLLSKTFIDITNPNPFEQKCIIIVLLIEVDSFLYPPLPGDHLLSQQTTNLKTS